MRPFVPNYVSHKRVEAYPIAEVADVGGELQVLVQLPGHQVERLEVPPGFFARAVPLAGDYVVRYEPDDDHPEGYLAQTPRHAFEGGYTPIGADVLVGLDFGQALRALKAGARIARAGWNGDGMWLAHSPGNPALPAAQFWAPPNRDYARDRGGTAAVLATISMRVATGEIEMGWAPTNTDLLAEDWFVLRLEEHAPEGMQA